jgi:hypothetical protein
MTEQISDSTSLTHLSALAEQAIASDAWWKADAEPRNELALPSRVLAILDKAGIRTVEELKAAGPRRLRMLDGIGKLAFDQIINLLRALDRRANGGES